ncbi:RNA recognition motif domain-containing protein [Streptomyces sp. NPDC018019]|uniref:RNA recognition motif domain-containing protein n=1 Tax=Streptomyces sp. NPDC018019 TaxID=3365030 RepID=UPI00379FA7F9
MTTKVHIENLSPFATKESLIEAGSRFGFIREVTIERTPEGMCKGVASITYSTAEDAAQAAEGLNGCRIHNREMKASVAPAADS